MKTSNAIIGIIAAGTAGAILGILFAPDKGENTRKKISDKSKEMKNDLTSKVSDILSSVEQNIATSKNKIEAMVEGGIAKIHEATNSK